MLVLQQNVDHSVGSRAPRYHALGQAAAVGRRDAAQDGELVHYGASIEPCPHSTDVVGVRNLPRPGANEGDVCETHLK